MTSGSVPLQFKLALVQSFCLGDHARQAGTRPSSSFCNTTTILCNLALRNRCCCKISIDIVMNLA
jgi:hypothetical protein